LKILVRLADSDGPSPLEDEAFAELPEVLSVTTGLLKSSDICRLL